DAATGGREIAHHERVQADHDDREGHARPYGEDTAFHEHRGRVRAEAIERGVAERHEARVAHEQVEAHGDGAEQQRVEGEQQVVPRHAGHERHRGQEREDHERAPAEDVHSSTPSRPKKPRGRTMSTTIMMPKIAMATRCGFIHSENRLCAMPMTKAATTEPPMLPIPPRITTMNASRIISRPICGWTVNTGASSRPASAASAPDAANVSVNTRLTSTPSPSSISASCTAARTTMPVRVRVKKSHSVTRITDEAASRNR